MNVQQIQEWLMEDIGERSYSFEDLAKLIKIEHRGKMINLLPIGVEVLWAETWTFE